MCNEIITNTSVSEDRRLAVIEDLFGLHFPLTIEPAIYAFAERLCKDYTGGYWGFYTLSNGGFYMAPESDEQRHVACDMNYFEGNLSTEAFGITCCLYAYSHISFSDNQKLSQLCSEQYHLLREYVVSHPKPEEMRQVLMATD